MSRLLFTKQDRAKYISHLDLMRTFQRVFQRSELEIGHTEGFNPHPFVSILLPLPLGFSSACEILEFRLLHPGDLEQVPQRLNAVMPEGIQVLECYQEGRKPKELVYVDYHVELTWSGGQPLSGPLQDLLSRDSLEVVKKSNKTKTGEKIVDIIPLIRSFQLQDRPGVTELDCRLLAQNPGLNPQLIITALERARPELRPDFVRYHRCAVLDGQEKPFR